MTVPIEYHEHFIPKVLADAYYDRLVNELDWVHKDPLIPREEYYVHDQGLAYSYGTGAFARMYESQPTHEVIEEIRASLKDLLGVYFDVVFLNIYQHERHHLGWHADDSPEMSDDHPIITVSLGAEREIWFRPATDLKDVTKVKLHHGSACVMLPGMQDTHHHRIPKNDRVCGPRISLTFRVYVPTEE